MVENFIRCNRDMKLIRKILNFLFHKDSIVFSADGKIMWYRQYVDQKNLEYELEEPFNMKTAKIIVSE